MDFRRSQAAKREAVVFVANDIAGLLHHRRHLIDRATKTGAHPILVGDTAQVARSTSLEYRHIAIERFKLHFSDLTLFFCVLRTLLGLRPRVLHLISIKPYLYGGLAAQIARLFGWKGKVVVTVPGLGRLYDNQRNSVRESLRRYLVERILRISVRDATVSFETTSDRDFWVARGNVAPERTVVTRGTGIDLAKFAPPTQQRESSQLRVLYAGRLLRSKGLDVFLNAASLNDNPNVQMFVAGRDEPKDPDGISSDALTKHAGIVFLGAISDMPALLTDIDVVVLPSRYNEGIPRILLEAAACGCVAIATRFPGSLELIEEGRTGYFLHSQDSKEQAQELVKLLDEMHRDQERRQRVGANAADYVRNNGFSAEDVTAAFWKMYETAGLPGPNRS